MMIRYPKENERMFVRNATVHQVTFSPSNLLVIARGHGVWVDEHWPSDAAFCQDYHVMSLVRRGHLSIEYQPRDKKPEAKKSLISKVVDVVKGK
jgi:hypothetical protein